MSRKWLLTRKWRVPRKVRMLKVCIFAFYSKASLKSGLLGKYLVTNLHLICLLGLRIKCVYVNLLLKQTTFYDISCQSTLAVHIKLVSSIRASPGGSVCVRRSLKGRVSVEICLSCGAFPVLFLAGHHSGWFQIDLLGKGCDDFYGRYTILPK